MRLLDRRRQHHRFRSRRGRQGETPPRGNDPGQSAQLPAQPADLDAQPCPVRLVGVLGAEGAGEKHRARHVGGEAFAQRTRQGKQHRARGKRNGASAGPHHMAAGIHHQRFGGKQRLHLGKVQSLGRPA